INHRKRPRTLSPHPERSRREAAASSKDEGRRTHSATATSPLPLRQLTQRIHIPADQRFLLRAGPTFELALGGNRIGDAIEILLEDELDRPAACGIAAKAAGIVLREPILQRGARAADVVRAVGAAEDVDVSVHWSVV